MGNSYRIKTQVGSDQTINLQIDQEFDFLEILSLKIQSQDIYTRNCADYGVIVGRVTANGGFGLPNVRVSVFVPLQEEDENNEIISTLYPYKSTNQKNEDGYRYNLLPYEKSYSQHVPTGTFPTRNDTLTNPTVVSVYDKYYKYTVRTNESGDYMIMGVPLGNQTVFMDADLSDIGEFSLTPQDLIRMGRASENQLNGNGFKASPDLNSLPQIISLQSIIEVSPLWGQPEVCQIAINRVDFDLRDDANIDIQPTAVFMGSVVSSPDSRVQRKNCKPATESGNLCDLITNPGEILCIRQTIDQDSDGRPVLETYEFDGGSKVIDENGTWLVDLPMNLEYITTNEFGERTVSLDPRVGVPTKSKYRFKVKWEQNPDLGEQVKRAYYLIPNIREYGWNNSSIDPYTAFPPGSTQYQNLQKSYAFSLDWNDYGLTGTSIGNQMIQDAIDCEDKFYEFSYNKVYTVSQFVDGYHNGTNRGRFLGIKQISDDTCDSTNNKFPTNDAVKNFDLIFIIFNFFFSFITLLLVPLMITVHLLAFLWPIIKVLITFVYGTLAWIIYGICKVINAIPFVSLSCSKPPSFKDIFNSIGDPFKNIALPTITYPDCEMCSCTNETVESNPDVQAFVEESLKTTSLSLIVNTPNPVSYGNLFDSIYCGNDPWFRYFTQNSLTQAQAEEICANQTTQSNILAGITTIQRVIAGVNENKPGQRTGYPIEGIDNNNDNRLRLSFDLTLTERLNLFNLKNQYFNSYGGFNQVKTYVNYENPANVGQFHYDNTITILCDPENIDKFTTGRVLSFQNPFNSLDPNTNKAQINFFGLTSATGTAKNISSISVSYANPDDPNSNLSVSYVVDQPADAIENCYVGSITAVTGEEWFYTDCDGVYHSGTTPQIGAICVSDLYERQGVELTSATCGAPKFLKYNRAKSDCEYFQVITAMTYSDFATKCPAVFTGQKSLNERYIGAPYYIWSNYGQDISGVLAYETYGPAYVTRPFYAFDDFQNVVVVVLQRGVDPNSVRQKTKIDLSRIFGQPYGTVEVESRYKLNIPIQKGLVLPRHDQFTNNESNPNDPIFFESFSFSPGTNYSGYTTNMHSHYSSLDSTSINSFQVKSGDGYTLLNSPKISVNATGTGPFVKAETSLNVFATSQYPVLQQPNYDAALPTNSFWSAFGAYYSIVGPGKKMNGYWDDEYVEGGSYFYATKTRIPGSLSVYGYRDSSYVYFSPAYSTGTTLQMLPQTQKIVMRTDRLPTSTSRTTNFENTYVLHQNLNMSFYFIDDEGLVEGYEDTTSSFLINESSEVFSQFEEQFQNTFSCQGLVPLKCYSGDSESFGVKPKTDDCYDKVVLKGGCYVFVSKAILSLFKDFRQLGEYKARTRVNFAACRGVFGLSFINNWVNGVLYHFPFRNLRFFKSPLDPVDPNGPYNVFCKETILLHDTNNFYYRVTPYNGNNFIGRDRAGRLIRNKKEIMFPTTILDMGPRDAFTQEITLNADFYGYNMTNMKSTTYQDPGDILNLFIISRQINSTWLSQIIGLGDGSVNAFFTRDKDKVDGDFAQMISINSELGVQSFNFDAYTAQSGSSTNNPFFVGQDRRNEPVIGIFFSSDTQTRDLVSPRRLIRNDSVPYNVAVYDYLGNNSQLIPFYSWTTQDSNTIFGTEYNDWRTTTIQKNYYQDFNRTNIMSNYFMGENPTAEFMKGYIYNRSNVLYAPGTQAEAYQFEGNKNTPDSPTYDPVNTNTYFTVGLPYHFYFGLGVGKSALNRFAKKFIQE